VTEEERRESAITRLGKMHAAADELPKIGWTEAFVWIDAHAPELRDKVMEVEGQLSEVAVKYIHDEQWKTAFGKQLTSTWATWCAVADIIDSIEENRLLHATDEQIREWFRPRTPEELKRIRSIFTSKAEN
jgi:hypothetical protein